MHKRLLAVVHGSYALEIGHGIRKHLAVYSKMFFVLKAVADGVGRSAYAKLYARSVRYHIQYVGSYFFLHGGGRG